MGYTHYWEIKKTAPKKVWGKIIVDFKKLMDNMPETTNTAGGFSEKDPLFLGGCRYTQHPIVDDVQVFFNGSAVPSEKRKKDRNNWTDGDNDKLSHEVFYIYRIKKDNANFNCCKTARKPYDLMVCAFLILAEYHAPKYYNFSSDGDYDEWYPAITFVSKFLGYDTREMVCKETDKNLKEEYKKWPVVSVQIKKEKLEKLIKGT
jgi:hypothetical protein